MRTEAMKHSREGPKPPPYQFDERSVMLFGALLYVSSYALVLSLLRSYRGRMPGIGTTLVIGAIWFSPSGFLNPLWGFQLSWYLAIFFFLASLAALNTKTHRKWWLALAIALAAAGSLSDVQGFLIWPVGMASLLWSRRRWWAYGAWLSGGLGTSLVYFWHYSFTNAGCVVPSRCTVGFEASHPLLTAKAFLLLLGYAVPTARPYFGIHELLGVVLLCGALATILGTWRTRGTRGSAFPLLLVTYVLLFDVLATEGRAGENLVQLTSNQYVQVNLLVLVAFVSYLSGNSARATGQRSRVVHAGALRAVALLFTAQVIVGDSYGLRSARARHGGLEIEARLLTNQTRIPASEWACATTTVVFVWISGPIAAYTLDPLIGVARSDHLSMFHGRVDRHYRREGPPTITACRGH